VGKEKKFFRSTFSVRIASVQWLSSSTELPTGWEVAREIETTMEKSRNPQERDKDLRI